MKMKQYLLRGLKVLTLLLAVVLSTLTLQWILKNYSITNIGRVNGFYLEKKDTIDVVFIGASEVYCDFAPGYAYGKYGFTSYPFVSQGSTVKNFTTAVKEAVRTQHPKLIVIEINGALYDEKHYNNEAYARFFIDNIPLNKNKVEYIQKYVQEDKVEYYLPIVKYHSNWKRMLNGAPWSASVIADDLRGYTLLKGVMTRAAVQPMDPASLVNLQPGAEELRSPLLEDAEKELIGLLEYCKAEGLNVLFVRFPHAVQEKERVRFGRAATAGDLIRSYGFPYVSFDFLIDEIGLDLETDFFNPEHLNINGQQKFTEYFGEFLIREFGITATKLDRRTQREWENCAAYYEEYAELNRFLLKNGIRTYLGDDILSNSAVKNRAKLMKYLK